MYKVFLGLGLAFVFALQSSSAMSPLTPPDDVTLLAEIESKCSLEDNILSCESELTDYCAALEYMQKKGNVLNSRMRECFIFPEDAAMTVGGAFTISMGDFCLYSKGESSYSLVTSDTMEDPYMNCLAIATSQQGIEKREFNDFLTFLGAIGGGIATLLGIFLLGFFLGKRSNKKRTI